MSSVWGAPAVSSGLTSWLVSRINSVGLDGSICAEYISSLLELYKAAADRDAAITDFLADSIAASKLTSDKERNKFVEDTVIGIRQRLGGAPVTVQPPALSGESKPLKGFKKGTKITGTALKEVVGNVKPSFVQRYSDDEREVPSSAVTASVSSIATRNQWKPQPVDFPVLDEPAPPMGTVKKTPSARKRNKAKEIGPDEDWGDAEDTHTPWKTPLGEDVMMTPMESPSRPVPAAVETTERVTEVVTSLSAATASVEKPKRRVELSVTTVSVANVAAPLPSPTKSIASPSVLDALLIPQDLLSFDFKFEGEDDVATPPPGIVSPEPIDLLKQMFSGLSTAVPSADATIVVPPATCTAVEARRYSVPFLLSVLKSMRKEDSSLELPNELKSLSKSSEQISPSKPPKSFSDTNWRTAKGEHTEGNGTWRASGYGNRWNGKTTHTKPPAAASNPPTEEGFW